MKVTGGKLYCNGKLLGDLKDVVINPETQLMNLKQCKSARACRRKFRHALIGDALQEGMRLFGQGIRVEVLDCLICKGFHLAHLSPRRKQDEAKRGIGHNARK